MVIPINLLVFILIFGLVILLTHFLLNKLTKTDFQTYNNNTTTNNTTDNNINQNNNLNNNNQNINQNMGNENIINNNIDPNKKYTKKEQAKMLKKKEKAEHREQIKQMMEAKKLKEQEKEREMLIKEKLKEEEKRKLEETLQKVKEEQQKKEDEIYNQWKDMIKIGEEGEEKKNFSDENVINEFLNYIKRRKVVSLEDLSGVFKISPNELVEKLNQFEKEGRILGIIDDRGKYIYVTEKEMSMIENLFIRRGRINKMDLIKECNKIIKFEPTEEDKIKIAEEQKEMLEKIENELSNNKK
jgi:hypothetical protein